MYQLGARYLLLLVGLLACVVGPATGRAASITTSSRYVDGKELTFIVITGELLLGDDKTFADVAVKADGAVVLLDSPGGNLSAGIAIGKAIRLEGFATLVPSGFQCASACALAWLGGRVRLMGPGATIGFHAAYDAQTQMPTSVGNAIAGAYLNELGLPTGAIAYITSAQPNDIKWLTFDDAESVGIEVKRFDVGAPSASNSSSEPATPPATANTAASGSGRIQILSGPTLDGVAARASVYRSTFSNLQIFRCANGWYAAMLVVADIDSAQARLSQLRSAAAIPADSFVPDGQLCSDLVNDADEVATDSVTSQRIGPKARALAAAQELQAKWSLPNAEALAYLTTIYPAQLSYYGHQTAAAAVLAEKLEFANRWPERRYVFEPGSIQVVCSTETICEVDGIVDWYAHSASRGATSIGKASVALIFTMGPAPQLISEMSTVLTRQVSKGSN